MKSVAPKLTIPNYRDRRQSVVRAAGDSWLHEFLPIHLQGPQGEALGLDTFVRTGGTSSPWIVHVSGTHGAEGYIGSDIQERVLREFATSKTGVGPNCLLVHGLNSFGMAWYRRANRGNVDLNRNSIDHASEIDGWDDDFSKIQIPARFFTSGRRLYYLFRILRRYGFAESVNRFASGQNRFAEGLFYCGKERELELKLLDQVLRRHIVKPTAVYFIDVHSGLGRFGQESLLLDGSGPENEKIVWERLLGRPCQDPRSDRMEYVSKGLLSQLVREVFRGLPVYAMVEEFGTYSLPQIFLGLLRENEMFVRRSEDAGLNPDLAKKMLRLFYPENRGWRQSCADAAVERFGSVYRRLAETSRA